MRWNRTYFSVTKSRPPVVGHMDPANIASVSNSGPDPAAQHRYAASDA